MRCGSFVFSFPVSSVMVVPCVRPVPSYFHNLVGSSGFGLLRNADSARAHCPTGTPATKNTIVTVKPIVSHRPDNFANARIPPSKNVHANRVQQDLNRRRLAATRSASTPLFEFSLPLSRAT